MWPGIACRAGSHTNKGGLHGCWTNCQLADVFPFTTRMFCLELGWQQAAYHLFFCSQHLYCAVQSACPWACPKHTIWTESSLLIIRAIALEVVGLPHSWFIRTAVGHDMT
ncbi:hypothetical protein ABBQ32_14199 [Trebouxia sp. C0010 RCD-2024]